MKHSVVQSIRGDYHDRGKATSTELKRCDSESFAKFVRMNPIAINHLPQIQGEN
jgi:hypothetical protein